MPSKFYIKRGNNKDYLAATKKEGELFYIQDENKIASYNTIYESRIDGGYFKDNPLSKVDSIDGGEF